jgi:hypothetical protein
MWAAAVATGDYPWTGFGHRYDPAVHRSVPIAWSVPESGEQSYEPLPLPQDVTIGNPVEATSAFGTQIGAGSVVRGHQRHAALWFRNGDEWQFDEPFDLEIGSQDHSFVDQIAGTPDWGLMVIRIKSATETDDEGDPVFRRQLRIARSLDQWDLLELPGVNGSDWFYGIHVDGEQGLISAVLDDDDNQAIRLFTTVDSGTTWSSQDVEVQGGQRASVTDVVFDDDGPIPVGQIGQDDEAEPAVFITDEGGAWRAQPADLLFTEAVAPDTSHFIAVQRMNDTTLLGVVDTQPGSRTFLSRDGLRWRADDQRWLNQSDEEPDSTVDTIDIVGDLRDGPVLAIRRWQAPVWLTATGTTGLSTDPYERQGRRILSLAFHDDRFVALISGRSPEVMEAWESADGQTWSRWKTIRGHESSTVSDGGDEFLTSGTDDGVLSLRTIGGSERQLELQELFNFREGTTEDALTAPAIGRNLVALRIETEEKAYVRFAFVDLGNAQESVSYLAEQAGDTAPRVVCPQQPDGTIAVLLQEADSRGTQIEVWADRSEPRIGQGQLASNDTALADVVMLSCGRFRGGLISTGVSCPLPDTGTTNFDECLPTVWTSVNGLEWTPHPDNDTLVDEEIRLTAEVTSLGAGALMIGYPLDRTSAHTLWLATADSIVPIALDSIYSLDPLEFTRLAIGETQVALSFGDQLYVGSIEDLVEEAFGDPAAIQAWNEESAAVIDRRSAALAALENDQPLAAPTPSPAQAAPPSQPATTPAPAATAPPTTVPPPAETARPTCAPGALTIDDSCVCAGGRLYDDGGQCKLRCRGNEQPDGFGGCVRADGSQVESGADSGDTPTFTLVCTTIVDSATGESQENCRAVDN